jgi:DNA-binding SARP family transcriptional activator/tetratricopeptide (TPR) repeat protein
MRVRLLGSVEVTVDGMWRPVRGTRRRALLAVLALHCGEVVGKDRLVTAVWGETSPRAANTLQSQVSYLRRTFAMAIEARPSGYLMELGVDGTDVLVAERLIEQASGDTDLTESAGRLEEALALWRGRPLADVAGPMWVEEQTRRMDRLRLRGMRELIDVRLALGQHVQLISQLQELVVEHPFDERLHGQLMLALYRAGRQVDALAVYQELRQAMAEDLGLDPVPALRDQHAAMLRQDGSLDLTTHVITVPGNSPASALRQPVGESDAESVDSWRRLVGALPADTGVFTGRVREIEQITAAAAVGQVLVVPAVVGMPGVGKTALAVHVAHQFGERFPDGHVFVDLHGHTAGRSPAEPGDVLARLLAADGVDPRQLPIGTEARSALWRARLAGRQALIVLDNAVDSTQVAPLLPASAGCLVLVTSRRFLGDLPTDTVTVSLDVLSAAEAEQMFLCLAPRVRAHADLVAELVAACGYLPLAVSLLARLLNRHRGWTVANLLTETRTRLLDVTAEHASIRAAFELSYQHLPAARQRFFRQLALHPGTEIEPHAAAALTGVSLDEATGQLDALHADSLLIEIGYHRYVMHDLIRSYASTLAAHDPAANRSAATDRLLDFYQHTTSTADARLSRLTRPTATGAKLSVDRTTAWPEPPYPEGPDQALSWLRTERANLLACLTSAAEPGRIVALTAGLTELLRRDGPWTDALSLHTRAVQAAAGLGDTVEHANALDDLATVRRLSGDYPAATQDMQLAVNIYRQLGNRLGEANALTGLGKALSRTADYAAAAVVVQQAQDVYRELGDRLGEAGALVELALTRGMTSDFPGAQQVLHPALALYQQLGDRPGHAYALRMLATAHCRLGDFTGARELLHLALDLYRQLDSRSGQALTLTDLGWAIAGTGDYPEAARCLHTALDLHRELDHRVGQSTALLFLGGTLRRTGDLPGATEALQKALRLNRDIHNRSGEVWTLNELGTVHQLAGDLDQAMTAHHQALELAEQLTSPLDKAQALAGFGRCALASGQRRDATTRLREALNILQRISSGEAAEVAAELAALT